MKFRLETMVNTYNVRSKTYSKKGKILTFYSTTTTIFQQLKEGIGNDY